MSSIGDLGGPLEIAKVFRVILNGPWTQVLQSVVPHELFNRVLQGDPSNALHLLRFDPCHLDFLLQNVPKNLVVKI